MCGRSGETAGGPPGAQFVAADLSCHGANGACAASHLSRRQCGMATCPLLSLRNRFAACTLQSSGA